MIILLFFIMGVCEGQLLILFINRFKTQKRKVAEQPQFPGQYRPNIPVNAAVLPPLLHKPVRLGAAVRPCGQADAGCYAECHPVPQVLAVAV